MADLDRRLRRVENRPPPPAICQPLLPVGFPAYTSSPLTPTTVPAIVHTAGCSQVSLPHTPAPIPPFVTPSPLPPQQHCDGVFYGGVDGIQASAAQLQTRRAASWGAGKDSAPSSSGGAQSSLQQQSCSSSRRGRRLRRRVPVRCLRRCGYRLRRAAS
jgi:hypothetical protein